MILRRSSMNVHIALDRDKMYVHSEIRDGGLPFRLEPALNENL
jgi:hypothetical protein